MADDGRRGEANGKKIRLAATRSEADFTGGRKGRGGMILPRITDGRGWDDRDLELETRNPEL